MNIEKILGKYFKIAPVAELSRCWRYTTATPAHTFNSYIRQASNDESFFLTTIRDHDDKDWVITLFGLIEKHEDYLFKAKNIAILENVVNEKYVFDSLAVITGSCHRTLYSVDQALNDKTFVFFPIKRFELSGCESAEEIFEIRDRYISTIDWKRAVYPKILMRYENKATSARSKGKIKGRIGERLILARPTTLHLEIDNLALPGAGGSFVEIENYLGRFCRVECRNNSYFVLLDKENSAWIEVSRTEIHPWVESFLRGSV